MLGKSANFFVVLRYGRSCQEMCRTILWVGKQNDSTTLQSVYSMHWWPSFQRRRIEIRGRIAKSMLSNCSQMLIWHELEDLILYGQWTNFHDRSQNGQMHVTNDYLVWSLTFIIYVNKQYCQVGKTAKQNRQGLFQDSDFAGDLEDSKSTSGGTLCVFGSHTFVPISWMCMKRTSVSHSSRESEIISLDAGLRLDGIPAIDLLDLIVAVLGNTDQSHKEQGCLKDQLGHQNPNPIHWHQKQTRRHTDQGKFHTWWMESIIFCVCLKLATSVLPVCSEVMSKKSQEDAGEERVTAKSKPMMNLVSRCSERNPDVLASTASQSLGKTTYESQIPLSPQTEQHYRTERPVVYARDAAKGLLTCLPLLHDKAQGKPEMKVNYLWARGLSSISERGDLSRTPAHQATQNGMLTKNVLLKSGNLMKWWK